MTEMTETDRGETRGDGREGGATNRLNAWRTWVSLTVLLEERRGWRWRREETEVEKDVRDQRDRWRRRPSEVCFSQQSSSRSPVGREHAWFYMRPSIRSVLIPFWDYDYAISRHHAAVDAVSRLHASLHPTPVHCTCNINNKSTNADHV